MALPAVGAAAVLTGVTAFAAGARTVVAATTGISAGLHALGGVGHIASAALGVLGHGVGILGTVMKVAVAPIAILTTAIVALQAVAATALATIIVHSVKIASEFQTNMQSVAAVTDSTREQLELLRDEVEKVSIVTGTNLREVSAAAFELAKGGVEIETQLGGALKSVVDLTIASGGELGLGNAVKFVAAGIKAFNLDASQAHIVADALTNAAQRSLSSFTDLGVAFTYAASTAVTLGIDIDQLSALLGVLANANIRGSIAGTGLRQAFVSLINPSGEASKALAKYNINLYDSDKATRPVLDVLKDLEDRFGTAAIASKKITEQERNRAIQDIFTSRGANVVLAILGQTVAAYEEFLDVQQRLTASEVATRMLLPLAKQFEILKNTVDVAANRFGEGFIPALSEATRAGLRFMSEAGEPLRKSLTAIALAITDVVAGRGLGEVFQLLGKAGVEAGSSVEKAIRAVLNIMLAMRDAITKDIAPALGTLGEALASTLPTDEAEDRWTSFGTVVSTVIRTISTWIANAIIQVAGLITITQIMGEAFGATGTIIGAFFQAVGASFQAIGSFAVDMAEAVIGGLRAIVDGLGFLVSASDEAITNIIPGFGSFREAARLAATGILQSLATIATGTGATADASADAADRWSINWSEIQRITVEIANATLRAIGNFLRGVGNAIANAADADIPVLSGIARGFQAGANAAAGFAGAVVSMRANVQRGIGDAGARIQALIGDVGGAWEEFGTTTRRVVDNTGAKFDELNARLDRLRALMSKPIDLSDTFQFPERGFNLDNLIQGFGDAKKSAEELNEEVERTDPGPIDDLGKAGKEAADKLSDAVGDVEQALNKLLQDFLELHRNMISKFEEIAIKAETRVAEAIADAAKSIEEANRKASDSIRDLNEQYSLERVIQERKDTLEYALEQEALTYRRYLDALEYAERQHADRIALMRKRIAEDTETAISRAQDAAAQTSRDALDDEKQARRDALDDERERRKRQEDLIVGQFKDRQEAELLTLKESGADQKTQDALKRKQELEFTAFKQQLDDQEKQRKRAEDKATRDRERAEAAAERTFRQKQEDEERKRKRGLEDIEIKYKQSQDAAAMVKKQQMEEQDRQFTEQQNIKKRTLDFQLEHEALERRLQSIEEERKARVKAINDALEEKKREIAKDAEDEVRKYKKVIEERLADLLDALTIKAPQIYEKGGEAVQPFIDALFDRFNSEAEFTLNLYRRLTDELQNITNLQTRVAQTTPYGAPRQAAPRAFQQGGIVPGPWGQPQLIQAHGQEIISGLNNEFINMVASKLIPILMPYIHVPTNRGTVVNNTNFTVNADYAETQSPVTLRQDMQALIMLSSR